MFDVFQNVNADSPHHGLIRANAELQSGGHTKLFWVPSDVYRNARRVVEVTASSGHSSRWSTSYGLGDAAKA
jgi:hypothetical protein